MTLDQAKAIIDVWDAAGRVYMGMPLSAETWKHFGVLVRQAKVIIAHTEAQKSGKKDCPYSSHANDCNCRGSGGDR